MGFLFRAFNMLIQAVSGNTALQPPEIGVLIADSIVSILWIVGGVILLRRMNLGFVCGLGLLFTASMLFVALVVFLLLQPLLTGAPFALADVVVVLVLGMVCSIRFILFLRGVMLRLTKD